MPFRRTLVLTTWMSLVVSEASAQTAQLQESKRQPGASFEAAASKPAIQPSALGDSKSSGERHADVKSSASAPGAAGPAARVQPQKAVDAPVSPTTNSVPQAQPSPTLPFQAARMSSKDEKGVRRDPSGRKGISPFSDAIRRGDEAALARDFARAEEAYRSATTIESENPLAYLRLGQIAVRSSQLDRAEVAYNNALRLSSRNAALHAAALFVLADLRERQGQREEAIAAWNAYADYLQKNPQAKGYPETPVERESRIRKYIALAAESNPVRERIELRVKEVDESNHRKAAKNPNANR